MAAKSKKNEKYYVVAVKDFEKTMEDIASGKMYVHTYQDEYPAILNNNIAKCSSHKDIRKFIKQTKQTKKEVKHYWESMISNGYTLFQVKYEKDSPRIEAMFNSNILKFIC